jgi:ATP-binding protein involved in chromosome partitioning
LVIDMPPGTGDAQISLAQLVPIDGIVVVTTPQELSLADTLRGMVAFRRLGVPILGLVENMSYFVCPETGQKEYIFGVSDPEAIAQQFETAFLGQIPLEPAIREGSDEGKPIMTKISESTAEKAMWGMAETVLAQVKAHAQWQAFSVTWEPDLTTRQDEPPPTGDAPEAMPIRALWQVDQQTLGIHWPNHEVHRLTVRQLRLACPCAHCVDEWSGRPLLDPKSVPDYIQIKEARAVGRYAIRFSFSDGHKDGIYTWPYLHSVGANLEGE